MRKSLLTLGAAMLALSSFGATRILYQQNFETAANVEETGWTAATPDEVAMSIASDSFGKFLEISLGQHNGRTAQLNWGQGIFLDKDGNDVLENGTYTIEYDFCIAKGSNNQYNSAITVFTNHAGVGNQPYRNPWNPAGYWQNYLFDMSQVNGESLQYAVDGGTIETTGEDGTVSYAIDYSDVNTFTEGNWYTVTLNVNKNDRTVEYSVVSLDGDIVKSGTRTVPETDANGDSISMYAEGIYVMMARYATIFDFDNIKIYYESDKDFANAPTVALTGLGQIVNPDDPDHPTEDLKVRTYTITFLDGEELHVVGTDGKEVTVDYADCEGAYQYTTSTSGTMQAWTVSGEATSEVIETKIDCVPYALPEATATISAVTAGFGKTYTLTVNNEDVPLRPSIFIDYEFTGVSGEKVTGEDQISGAKVTVKEAGTLKITTKQFGYESTTATVENNLEFETKKAWDFARMDKDQLKEAGFAEWTVLNSGSTSGFNNWTARKRLYYESATETEEKEVEGEMVTVPVVKYPFGFISEDNTTNVIEYSVIDRSAIAETKKGEYFEGLTIFPERGKVDEGGLPNVGILYRIGLYNDQTKNNNNNVYINDLEKNDFVVVNYINNYGGNSNHPSCTTDDEYYAQLAGDDAVYSVAAVGKFNEETSLYDVVHSLYRIDTAITKITVYKQLGDDAVEAIEAVNVDNNWYSIDGVRVAEPTRPGLYIHNGKKIIVK